MQGELALELDLSKLFSNNKYETLTGKEAKHADNLIKTSINEKRTSLIRYSRKERWLLRHNRIRKKRKYEAFKPSCELC
jgi:hypothetical protein